MSEKAQVEEKYPIQSLTLYFPNGATSSQCDDIARLAQNLQDSGVSEGGFTPNMHYDKFSNNSMQYTYGHLNEKRRVLNEHNEIKSKVISGSEKE